MSKLFDSEIVQKEMDEMTTTYMDLMMKEMEGLLFQFYFLLQCFI